MKTKSTPLKTKSLDAEQLAFAKDVLLSIQQHKRGERAAEHTPEKIVARRRGRPVGSVQATHKEPIKIRLDADILAALRETGDGWQTRINDTLRASMVLGGLLR
jgi:uncharacterized protein (DUF4415 family)